MSNAATRLRLYAKSAHDEGDQCCEVRTDDVLSVVAQHDALADALRDSHDLLEQLRNLDPTLFRDADDLVLSRNETALALLDKEHS